MFNSLYAICLLVEDYKKSLSFYKDTLGLTVHSQDTNYTDFKLGGILLAIFQKDMATIMVPKIQMNTGGGAVIAFPAKDIEKACKELQKKGIDIFEGPKKMPWGQTVAYFKDPDHNILEITN